MELYIVVKTNSMAGLDDDSEIYGFGGVFFKRVEAERFMKWYAYYNDYDEDSLEIIVRDGKAESQDLSSIIEFENREQ